MSMSLAAKPTLIDRLVPSSLVADIAVIAGGAALTALAAQVQFTIGNNPVPFTLQTLSVLLVGTVLGSVSWPTFHGALRSGRSRNAGLL